jgi:hypothetical protein
MEDSRILEGYYASYWTLDIGRLALSSVKSVPGSAREVFPLDEEELNSERVCTFVMIGRKRTD